MERPCEVCGAAFVPANKTGPKPRRCPACHASDRRANRRPKGRGVPPHPCADCGTETTRKFRCEPCSVARGKAQRAEWHRAHPESARAAAKRHAERFPWRFRKRYSVFGVTEDEFAAMLAAQGGRCPVCGDTEPGSGGWNLDHDHARGAKDRAGHRGVLCRACNLMLGNARDREDVLAAGIKYLRRHRLKVNAE